MSGACTRCGKPATHRVQSPSRDFIACEGCAAAYVKLAETIAPVLVDYVRVTPLLSVSSGQTSEPTPEL